MLELSFIFILHLLLYLFYLCIALTILSALLNTPSFTRVLFLGLVKTH